MTARELFIGSADGTKHQVVGDTMRVLAKSADTGGAFEIFEMTGPRDSGPPPHAHPWTESYTIIEGTLDVTIGDKTVTPSVRKLTPAYGDIILWDHVGESDEELRPSPIREGVQRRVRGAGDKGVRAVPQRLHGSGHRKQELNLGV